MSLKERSRLVADLRVVFQDPYSSLNPARTIGQTLVEPLRLHGRRRAEALQKARAGLESVGLPGDAVDRYPSQFSGGQRQRIAIARALVCDPKVVVLDEPVSALDLSTQAQVLNLLADLRDQHGLAFLFIAHDLGVVRFLAQRVVVLYRGQIMESGPVESVTQQPRHPYTVALTAAAPVPAAGRAGRPPGRPRGARRRHRRRGPAGRDRLPVRAALPAGDRRLRRASGRRCGWSTTTSPPATTPSRSPRSEAVAASSPIPDRRSMSSSRALSDVDLDALIGKLDLETKVRLLSGSGPGRPQAVPEIGLRSMTVSDGPSASAAARTPSSTPRRPSRRARRWPPPGTRTCCSGSAALLAGEAVRKGVDVVLGPTINLHRSPLAGGTSSASPRTRC